MDDFNAVGLAEGFVDAESEEQVVEAWQHLLDTGLMFKLQGWFGRTGHQLVEKGVIEDKENRFGLKKV